MTRIGFAIMDPTGGGCHYRAHLPARVLRAHGHEVVVGETVRYASDWRLGLELEDSTGGVTPATEVESFYDEAGGWTHVFVPDVLVLTAGWSLGITEMLNIGRASGAGDAGRSRAQRLVLDFDDGLEAPVDNAGFRPDQVARKVGSALEVDRLTCSTPAVARDLSAVRRPTAVVRNMIDPDLFADALAANQSRLAFAMTGEGRWGRPLVLGYRGPIPWHRFDIVSLRDGVGPLVELGCRFVHIGGREDDATTFAELVGIDPELVEVRPQVPFAEYPASLAGIDVGLVPFSRRAWSSYKSNVGALEWNAAGVPWVASDQSEYRRLDGLGVVAGRFGWGSRVRELLNPVARHDRYHAQRMAAARYDVSAHVERSDTDAWSKALGL